MKEYSWVCGEFVFKLKMDSVERTIFNDEGIHQIIILYVNDYIIFKTGWGVEHFFEIIEREKNHSIIDYPWADVLFTENKLYFLTNGFQEDFDILEGDDCIEFYNWLITTLSIDKSRRLKIEKIRNLIF